MTLKAMQQKQEEMRQHQEEMRQEQERLGRIQLITAVASSLAQGLMDHGCADVATESVDLARQIIEKATASVDEEDAIPRPVTDSSTYVTRPLKADA